MKLTKMYSFFLFICFFAALSITSIKSGQLSELKSNKICVWVFFTDKNQVGETDERNLPVKKEYVDAVIASGAKHRATTKWLNGISVEATPEVIIKIKTLPFVKEVKEIKPSVKRNFKSGNKFAAKNLRVSGNSTKQLDQIKVNSLHRRGYKGKGVTICVIDSGFSRKHEALKHVKVIGERDFVNDDSNTADEEGDTAGQDDHGTTVLSVIAGYKKGRFKAPLYRASYLLAKTEDMSSETPVEEDYWLEAVEWADENGADIINSSLAYYDFDDPELTYEFTDLDGETATVTKAANIAAEKGILVVNSAGNYGLKPPADGKHLISVGAVDADGNVWSGSGTGPTYDGRIKPDVVARGFETYCANPNSSSKYTQKNGTSYSTPLIAGLAGLLLEAHPDWTYDRIKKAILNTADNKSTPDNNRGYGIPDGLKALRYALSITTARLPPAKIGRRYFKKLKAEGNKGKLAWKLSPESGELPDALMLKKNGVIKGIPKKMTSGKAFTFTVMASDKDVPGKEAEKDFSIEVK